MVDAAAESEAIFVTNVEANFEQFGMDGDALAGHSQLIIVTALVLLGVLTLKLFLSEFTPNCFP